MANKTINDLPALVTQATTDVYEMSNNAASLSSKETRAQMLSYNKANIAGAPYAVGDLIYADSTTTLAKIPDVATTNALISGGVGVAPSYGKITYNHMQTESASTLLGNPTGGGTVPSEITLGSGLAFSGTSLLADVTLQDAYDNGTGVVAVATGKPLELTSTTAGFVLPNMTDAQFAAIATPNSGLMAWSTDTDRITANRGTPGAPVIDDVAFLSDITAVTYDSAYGEMYFVNNASATTIAGANTPVKVTATYVSGDLFGFTHGTGTLTYTATTTREMLVIATVTAIVETSDADVTFYIAKNGTPIAKSGQTIYANSAAKRSDPIKCLVSLATNDTLELWVENNTDGQDITVIDANFTSNTMGGNATGDITIAGENYLSLSGQEITANPVNLSNTNVTGTLAAARFPALTGDVANSAGSLATTVNKIKGAPVSDATPTSGFILIAEGVNWAANQVTGDVRLNYNGVVTIQPNAITFAKIQTMAPGLMGRSDSVGGPTLITIGDGLTLTSNVLTATSVAPQVEVIGTVTVPRTYYGDAIGTYVSMVTTISGTNVIPANSLGVGETIEVNITGYTSSITAGGTGTIRCKFGSLTFDGVTASSTTGGATSVRAWSLVFKVTGVSSTQIIVSAAGYYEDDSHTVRSLRLYNAPVANTIDLSVNNTIDVLYNMGASGSNAYNFVAHNMNIIKYTI